MSENNSTESGPDDSPPTILGWVARAVSLAVIFALVATVVWQMSSEDKEIRFSADVVSDEVRQHNGGYLIPVEITNEGSRTASSVNLDLQIASEKTEIRINMIGARETVQFFLFRDQLSNDVSVQVTSYELP